MMRSTLSDFALYDVRNHTAQWDAATEDTEADYKLEAAPEGESSEVVTLRCGGPAPFMTYDEIMKAVEKDSFLKVIIEERERMITALAKSFSPRQQQQPYIPDYMIMLKSEAKSYHRDPFWAQWQQHKLQADQNAQWKTPIFTDERVDDINADLLRYIDPKMFEVESGPVHTSVVANTPKELKQIYLDEKARHRKIYDELDAEALMAESEMDWEDDDATDPGVGPGNLDIIAAPTNSAQALPTTPPGYYPRVTTEGIGLLDRCYFCAIQRNITRFDRSSTDHLITCVVCLYDHLGLELLRDGTLRKVPADI